MLINRIRPWIAVAALAAVGFTTAAQAATDAALAAAVASPTRNPAHVARDKARHPAEELTFFGITPKMNVVELWPGGGYWTDILGPYLAAHGHYTVALTPPNGEDEPKGFRARIQGAK